MRIYFLDSASTTRPYDEVIETMADVMRNHYGNPSSIHEMGQDAKNIIENVRAQIAEDIGCELKEIIFTSGACEANSLALCGTRYNHIITTHLEHKSIEEILKSSTFTSASYIPVDVYGNISFDYFQNILKTYNSALVSIQYGNSEIGTIQDIARISNAIKGRDFVLHVDATQVFPEGSINVKNLGIDLMSVSAQKFHGPKGIGFLYCRDGIALSPLIYGSQENGLRGGTYNTPAIAGMGKALEINRGALHGYVNACTSMNRDNLAKRMLEIPGVHLNGPKLDVNRLFNNLSIRIDGVKASDLVTLASIYGIYISAGSACCSGESVPSSTLKAIGLNNDEALSTIRITVDETLNDNDISYIVEILSGLIKRLRTS